MSFDYKDKHISQLQKGAAVIDLNGMRTVTMLKTYGRFSIPRPNRANSTSGIPKGRADLKLRKF